MPKNLTQTEVEMNGLSVGVSGADDRRPTHCDEGNAVACDLCGISLASQSALLEHHKSRHMNDVGAEQAQLSSMGQRFRGVSSLRRPEPVDRGGSPGPSVQNDDALAKLQSRLGLSITPVGGGQQAQRSV